MRHASLFSGIGGFDLAAEWMGWQNVLQCENDTFCRKNLRYHFPNAKLYGDIRSLDGTQWRGKIDILTGGFPCQPFSSAGRKRGKADNRFLWPEMLRIICEARPTWIVAENVAGLINMAQFDCEPPVDDEGCAIGDIGDTHHRSGPGILKEILVALKAEGYDVQPVIIPACALGAQHRRDRIWFIAYSESAERERDMGRTRRRGRPADSGSIDAADSNSRRQQRARLAVQPTGDDAEQAHTDAPRACEDADHAERKGLEGHAGDGAGAQRRPEQTRSGIAADWREPWPDVATRLCRMVDGIPAGLDAETFHRFNGKEGMPTYAGWRRESIKAYGNAIVPQIAYQIFQSIACTNQ